MAGAESNTQRRCPFREPSEWSERDHTVLDLPEELLSIYKA